MIQIQVESVTKKPTVWDTETFYRVLCRGQWIGLHGLGDRVPVKGEVYNVEEVKETKAKGGMTFYDATAVYAPPNVKQQYGQAQSVVPSKAANELIENANVNKGTRTTPYTQPLSQWERVVDAALAIAGKHSIIDDAARVSFVACLTIPFEDGKIFIDDDWIPPAPQSAKTVQDDPQAVEDWGEEPPKPEYERHMAHSELEETCRQYGGMCVPTKLPSSILFGVTGTRNVLELSEKEAIEARHKVEKLIDDNADWKTKLLLSIKECCKVKKLDYEIQKWEILWNCAGTRSYKDLDQLTAKKGLLVLKEKYWPEMP